MINWLRVLQISKEILAIDEFNVNACVSPKSFLRNVLCSINSSLAPSLSVLCTLKGAKGTKVTFFQKFAMAASNKLNSDEFYRFEKRHKELLKLKV